jgi:CO/xanthine dehydrogenase Mo-binding subunit
LSRRTARPAIGANVLRKDATAKVTGAARYVDDLAFPRMIFGRTIRSTIASGEIVSVRFASDLTGFVVADFRDVPGRNVIAMIQDDQPCLAERRIRHPEEPILLLAHEDREKLLAAKVDLEYLEEPSVFDPEESSHAFKSIRIEKGELAKGFAEADRIVEGEYRTGHQEHVAIEPNGVIAVPENGGITIHGSMQCPYYVHRALMVLLGLPADRVRVVQTETGGGFGGKEDYPSIIAGHAAILALKARRPVKLVYDRGEEMAATTKRHPSVVRHRTGVTSGGRITAMEIDVILDGGAYCTLSPVVLSRGVIHATGPYRCEHVRITGRAMMTNTPPNGAFRGFGAPQTLFAAEVHADRIAEALEIDPVRFRTLNALRPGDATATGQVLGRDASALRVLREAVRRTRFQERRKKLRGSNRGIGLSLFFHGSGFTGAGEVKLASRAALELTEHGVRILVGSTEIGQGTRTMHAQIVADAMGIPYDRVEVAATDTSRVPDSGPTVASRTCMVVGRILERCAAEMKSRLGRLSPARYLELFGRLVVEKEYERPVGMTWDDDAYRGDAYGAYGWGCNVAEVEIDPDTCEVRPTRFTAVMEIGKAIHPDMVRGQIEGGTSQGIGFALTESVVMKDGRMANAQLTNYAVPTTLDTPPMDVALIEVPYAHGPAGAKGIGEMPIDGPAPAIVNAIRHAALDVRQVPALPEVLLKVAAATGWNPCASR